MRTQGWAAVVYQAYYSDGGNGADPPFGKGYGGNAGGMTTSKGLYSDKWLVSASAPLGPAYVIVVVHHRDREKQAPRETLKVPFVVAGRVPC